MKPADFSVTVDGLTKTFVNTNDTQGATSFNVPAGTYGAVETVVDGYKATYGDNCASLQVAPRQTVICEITNEDIAGSLTIYKTVVGGTKEPGDFNFNVAGTTNDGRSVDTPAYHA